MLSKVDCGKRKRVVCCKAKEPEEACKAQGGLCIPRDNCKGAPSMNVTCKGKKQVCCPKPGKPDKPGKPGKPGKPDKPGMNKRAQCKINGGSCVPSGNCSSDSQLPHKCGPRKVCCNEMRPTLPPHCKSINGSECVAAENCSDDSALPQFRCRKGRVCCKVQESLPRCRQGNGTCVMAKKCDDSDLMSGYRCPKDKQVCCREKKKACKTKKDASCVAANKCPADRLNSDLVCPGKTGRRVCCTDRDIEP